MMSANISKQTRLAVYRRDNFCCALCDSSRGLQIHHVIPRSQGGTDFPHNLITLCWKCHAVAHGTRLPEYPEYMGAAEMAQACVEYVADYYAPDWNPWKDRPGG
ncbi:MAG: HNH endonuclease [Oscillospiraceae bacterium]